MKNPAELDIYQVLKKEIINNFVHDRNEDRAKAALCIAKIQKENAQQFNKKRKPAKLYTVGDLVAIERMQKEKGGKFRTQMIGPYEITRVLRNERYQVKKVGFGEGPMDTSTAADRMKPWACGVDSSDDE